MRYKVATFSLVFADVILFISTGFTLTTYPGHNASRQELKWFAVRSGTLVAVLLLTLLATVILVWMWMRSLREEYRLEAQENMKNLIEGTLRDHESKQS
ncbi:MAG TPA: hypothetical protein VGL56_06610 [Fimbriimonadaceae bacterium]|jgi:uncharacterized membrane protein